jgi:hypothetical protein
MHDGRSSSLLEAPLGASRVLACPGGGRLYLLNPVAAWLWEARRAGLSEGDIAAAVADRFWLSEEAALADLRDIHARWRRAGLLDCAPTAAADRPALPRAGQQMARGPAPDVLWAVRRWRLWLADQALTLTVADADLADRLAPVVAQLDTAEACAADVGVVLAGSADDWDLATDGVERARGIGADAALTELVELGCQGPPSIGCSPATTTRWRRTSSPVARSGSG